MDDPNITMDEYIRLEEEKAHRRRKVFNWETAMYVFNETLTSEATLLCEPTVSPLNVVIDFRISFDESDNEDCTVIFDKNSFFYKIISVNNLKTDSENDNDKVNMPFLPSPESTVSYINDLDYFNNFEKEFPAIIYNDAQMSKLDFFTEPTLSPQHIDEFDLKDETSLSECDEVEQNVLYFNDLFYFNVIYPDDLKSDEDNDDDKIDIEHSSGDLPVIPLPNVINNNDRTRMSIPAFRITTLKTNTPYPSRRYGVFVPALTKDHKRKEDQYAVKMDDPNITMDEYIRLEEEKARRLGKCITGKLLPIVFNDTLTSEAALSCEPTVSSLNDEIDFRISFDESDDEYCTVNMPLLPSPKPTVSYFNDLDYFNDFEKEFTAIIYNDAQTSKLDFLTEPTLNPQHIDEFDLKDETSLSECDEEEQNILYFNDLFSFNVIYPDDSKSDEDNDDEKIDIEHSSGDLSVIPLPNVINNNDGAYAHASNKLLETSYDTSSKFFKIEIFIKELCVNIVT
ncbi:hypothetical protein Tco_1293210 [Tanacetum coccineum]